MNKYIKENKYVLIIALIVVWGLFYWFQIRPASIKKSCSFVTENKEAITKKQAEINKVKLKEECEKSPKYCILLDIETKERQEKIEVREATDKEYNQCLRHNGLSNL